MTPDDVTIFEIAAYNGALYVATGGIPAEGSERFSVLKTDAAGPLPYTFKEIIPPGAFHPGCDAAAAYSMFVFDGLLYVGTSREVFRINADDTWELVVGAPRTTPSGPLAPLSGFDDGFGFRPNIHMWRMAEHEGALYVCTLDTSTESRRLPLSSTLYGDLMGFDLYATADGWHFSRVTRTAFAEPGTGDVFDHGARGLASTPHGLFVGSSNRYYGLNLWRGERPPDPVPAPQRLEEIVGLRVVLSWEQPPGADRFHVLRDTAFQAPGEIAVRGLRLFEGTWVAVDATAGNTLAHGYQVVAEDAAGRRSGPSNVAASPSYAPPVDFPSVQATLTRWAAPADWQIRLQQARALFEAGAYGEARASLRALLALVEEGEELGGPPAWRLGDVRVLLGKLTRWVTLVQLGMMPPGRVSPLQAASLVAGRPVLRKSGGSSRPWRSGRRSRVRRSNDVYNRRRDPETMNEALRHAKSLS